jgi:hypothetical protein
MASIFALGSDPFTTGLPVQSSQPSYRSIGFTSLLPELPSLPSLPSLSDLFDYTAPGMLYRGIQGQGGIGGFLAKITSGHLWERIGFIVLGLILITAALFMLANKTTLLETVRDHAPQIP